MKISEADVVWTPGGAIRIEQHGSGWQKARGEMWAGADTLSKGSMGRYPTKGDPIKQLLALFVLFNTVVVRDAIEVAAAHAAFLEIDEYRATISPDAPGADP